MRTKPTVGSEGEAEHEGPRSSGAPECYVVGVEGMAEAELESGDILVRLFHPMMPHLAEECWAALGHSTLVATEAWPALEPDLLVENTITLPVQVNGKKRGDVTVARDAAHAVS